MKEALLNLRAIAGNTIDEAEGCGLDAFEIYEEGLLHVMTKINDLLENLD